MSDQTTTTAVIDVDALLHDLDSAPPALFEARSILAEIRAEIDRLTADRLTVATALQSDMSNAELRKDALGLTAEIRTAERSLAKAEADMATMQETLEKTATVAAHRSKAKAEADASTVSQPDPALFASENITAEMCDFRGSKFIRFFALGEFVGIHPTPDMSEKRYILDKTKFSDFLCLWIPSPDAEKLQGNRVIASGIQTLKLDDKGTLLWAGYYHDPDNRRYFSIGMGRIKSTKAKEPKSGRVTVTTSPTYDAAYIVDMDDWTRMGLQEDCYPY